MTLKLKLISLLVVLEQRQQQNIKNRHDPGPESRVIIVLSWNFRCFDRQYGNVLVSTVAS